MFQTVETGSKIQKKAYLARIPELRTELLQAQFRMKEQGIPLYIIISGVEGSGKGELVNQLNEWLDARFIETHVLYRDSSEDLERPEFWKYWKAMPSRGNCGIFFGAWYTAPIVSTTFDPSLEHELESKMYKIRFLEQMLIRDKAVISKFWLHIPKKEQKKRFKFLESDSRTKWRVQPKDWEFHKHYDQFIKVAEKALRITDTSIAPWYLVDAQDDNFRNILVAETLLQQMNHALENNKSHPNENVEKSSIVKSVNILDTIDFPSIEDKKQYKLDMNEITLEIEKKAWKSHKKKISSVFVFEGWDAAGKGGAIRRIIPCLDAKFSRVIQIAAPTDEELAHHYLWRFWRHLPKNGNVTIYDRSWYGRVLVERVEGFASEDEWKRSYLEINDFEQQLSEQGINVVKFWIHISPEEQLERFEMRKITPHKRHKITDEDWRNREKWDVYKEAVHEMISKTDTSHAPWRIISGNDKKFGRLQVLKEVHEALSRGLNQA